MNQNSMGGIPPMQNQNTNGGYNNYGQPMNSNMGSQQMAQPMQPMAPTMQPVAPPIAQPKPKKDNSAVIETIILAVVCVVAAAAIIAAVYFFMQWKDLNDNTQVKINQAVSDAEATLTTELNEKFEEESKLPNLTFTGPSDYGSLSFNYPRTWNIYEATVISSSTSSDYSAYFRPDRVLATGDQTARYALRFTIKNQNYSTVTKTYENLVTTGKVTSTPFTADNNAITGVKYKGELKSGSNAIQGIVVVVKINDKTAIFQTDSYDFESDFNTVTESLRKNS